MGFHWKLRFLGEGGVHEKPIYRGICRKRGAWTVCKFKVVFLRGVDTPMHTMLIVWSFHGCHEKIVGFSLTLFA